MSLTQQAPHLYIPSRGLGPPRAAKLVGGGAESLVHRVGRGLGWPRSPCPPLFLLRYQVLVIYDQGLDIVFEKLFVEICWA